MKNNCNLTIPYYQLCAENTDVATRKVIFEKVYCKGGTGGDGIVRVFIIEADINNSYPDFVKNF
jgi:hypothetical protein